KCQQLTETAEAAAQELGIEYEIEKVKEINQIMKFGVMITPALVVDGEVKVSGKVPSVQEAKEMIQ
ncbi:MAG: thioredoxin family protein, partial [Candidatus Hydrogenedentes bacterium]|nr:thioredoxin family protein [Candidatus Hydrogenedentota bacterium]